MSDGIGADLQGLVGKPYATVRLNPLAIHDSVLLCSGSLRVAIRSVCGALAQALIALRIVCVVCEEFILHRSVQLFDMSLLFVNNLAYCLPKFARF